MDDLTAYFLSLLEVIEKEAKLFRLMAAKTIMGISMFVAGTTLVVIGILVFAYTCFTILTILIGKVGAGLLTSGLILLGGGVFLWKGTKSFK